MSAGNNDTIVAARNTHRTTGADTVSEQNRIESFTSCLGLCDFITNKMVEAFRLTMKPLFEPHLDKINIVRNRAPYRVELFF